MLSLLLISGFMISSVQSVSYYNWIKNSLFDGDTNLCEDGGLESGGYSHGVVYGNWISYVGNPMNYISTVGYYRSGVWGLYAHYTGNQYVWYNLTSQVLGADIVEFTFWVKSISYGSDGVFVAVYYSDSTYDTSAEITTTLSVWEQKNVTSVVNDAKYVVAFLLYMIASDNDAFDDFRLIVANSNGQSEINFNTNPWWCGGIPSVTQQVGYNWYGNWIDISQQGLWTSPITQTIDVDMIGLNTVFGYSTNSSVYMGSDESRAGIYQNIEFLDSDLVHFLEMRAYTSAISNIGIKVNIIYSDRSYTTKTMNLTSVGSWQQLIFSGFISPNKYIVQVQIMLATYYPQYVNIDDVFLWASTPTSFKRFTYSVTPIPVSKTDVMFYGHENVNYVFSGYVWNNNVLDESGTFIVQSIYGTSPNSGSFTNGQFSFNIPSRSYATAGDHEEMFYITIVVGDESMIFGITARWISEGNIPNEGGNGNISNTNIPIETFINFILLLCFIVLPAIGFGFYCGFHGVNPLFGFIGALTMLTAIGYLCTLVPLWFFATTIIVDVVLGLYIFNSSRSGVG